MQPPSSQGGPSLSRASERHPTEVTWASSSACQAWPRWRSLLWWPAFCRQQGTSSCGRSGRSLTGNVRNKCPADKGPATGRRGKEGRFSTSGTGQTCESVLLPKGRSFVVVAQEAVAAGNTVTTSVGSSHATPCTPAPGELAALSPPSCFLRFCSASVQELRASSKRQMRISHED